MTHEKPGSGPRMVDLAPVADALSTSKVNHLPKPNAEQLAFQDPGLDGMPGTVQFTAIFEAVGAGPSSLVIGRATSGSM